MYEVETGEPSLLTMMKVAFAELFPGLELIVGRGIDIDLEPVLVERGVGVTKLLDGALVRAVGL